MMMEIVKNRQGNDIVIEKITPTKLRVMGESLYSRISLDENKNITMFDFEGGPFLMVGGKIKYGKTNWTIESLVEEKTDIKDLVSVIVEIKF